MLLGWMYLPLTERERQSNRRWRNSTEDGKIDFMNYVVKWGHAVLSHFYPDICTFVSARCCF